MLFESQVDTGVLPWVGCETRRRTTADLMRDQRTATEALKFDVEDMRGRKARRHHRDASDPDQGNGDDRRIAVERASAIVGDVVTHFPMPTGSYARVTRCTGLTKYLELPLINGSAPADGSPSSRCP